MENSKMLLEEKAPRLPYESPQIECYELGGGISILEIVSLEGEIYDFEDGDDF